MLIDRLTWWNILETAYDEVALDCRVGRLAELKHPYHWTIVLLMKWWLERMITPGDFR